MIAILRWEELTLCTEITSVTLTQLYNSFLHGIYKLMYLSFEKKTLMEKSYFSTVLLFSASDEESYFKKLIKEEKSPTLLRTILTKAQALSSNIVALSYIFPYGFLFLWLDDQALNHQEKSSVTIVKCLKTGGTKSTTWPSCEDNDEDFKALSWNFLLTPVFQLRLSYMYSVTLLWNTSRFREN